MHSPAPGHLAAPPRGQCHSRTEAQPMHSAGACHYVSVSLRRPRRQPSPRRRCSGHSLPLLPLIDVAMAHQVPRCRLNHMVCTCASCDGMVQQAVDLFHRATASQPLGKAPTATMVSRSMPTNALTGPQKTPSSLYTPTSALSMPFQISSCGLAAQRWLGHQGTRTAIKICWNSFTPPRSSQNIALTVSSHCASDFHTHDRATRTQARRHPQ